MLCLRFAPQGLFCAAVTASPAQVNQPIHTQAIESWRRYEGLLQGVVGVLQDG